MAELIQWLRRLEADLVARLNAWSRRMECWQDTRHLPELGCTCEGLY